MQNRREGEKPDSGLHFNIIFGPHFTQKDFQGLEQELANADIYFPENAGWEPSYETAYQAYASGKYSTAELQVDPPLKMELGILERIGKSGKVLAVGLVDLPNTHPLLPSFYKLSSEKAIAAFNRGKFTNALSLINGRAERAAVLARQRQDYIHDQIRPKISSLINLYPSLKAKLEREGIINIVMSLGAFHTEVYHRLKAEGEYISCKFTETPLIFSPLEELERRHFWKKPISGDLIARALMSSKLSPYFIDYKEHQKIVRAIRHITNQLKLEDVKAISLDLRKNRSMFDNLLR